MTDSENNRDVVLLERGAGSTVKPFLLGLLLGAGLALLFAPASGAETRRQLQRRARRWRAKAEDALDEARDHLADPGRAVWDVAERALSARDELEERLAEARARRRAGAAPPPKPEGPRA